MTTTYWRPPADRSTTTTTTLRLLSRTTPTRWWWTAKTRLSTRTISSASRVHPTSTSMWRHSSAILAHTKSTVWLDYVNSPPICSRTWVPPTSSTWSTQPRSSRISTPYWRKTINQRYAQPPHPTPMAPSALPAPLPPYSSTTPPRNVWDVLPIPSCTTTSATRHPLYPMPAPSRRPATTWRHPRTQQLQSSIRQLSIWEITAFHIMNARPRLLTTTRPPAAARRSHARLAPTLVSRMRHAHLA